MNVLTMSVLWTLVAVLPTALLSCTSPLTPLFQEYGRY